MADSATESKISPKTYYSIEAPGVLRPNSTYNVAVTLFAATEPCEINIKLWGGELKLERHLNAQPMSTNLVTFEIPELSIDEDYYLEAESVKGTAIKEKIKLGTKPHKPLTYIQCDKQAYKRGDNVDYRVLFLETESLRPATYKRPFKVQIRHADNVVSEHNNIMIKNGLYTDRWEIPKQAAHGMYNIEVLSDTVLLHTKAFEVIDFEPPKFDIKILTSKTVPYRQKQIILGIDARYADNTPVNGNCKLELECVAGFFSGVYIEKSMPIFGKTSDTIIDLVEDLKIDESFEEKPFFSDASVMVKVTVSDESTGNEEVLTELLTVERTESKETENIACSKIYNEPEQAEDIGSEKAIQILPPKENALIGEQISFSIKLNKPTKFCIYFVIARGDIIKSELIEIQDYTLPIIRTLDATFQLVPRAFILAYFIKEDVLYFDEVGFNLAREFESEITAAETSNPNDLVSIEIQTAPNTVVGVMAVDKNSVLLNAKNDLCAEEIFNDLYYIRSEAKNIGGTGRYPGLTSGLVTLTNAELDGFQKGGSSEFSSIFYDKEHMEFVDVMPHIDVEKYKKNIELLMQEREQVFGNWIFTEKESDQNGFLKIEAMLPNRPTTWLLTAFALSPEKGFTMTKKPLEIKTTSSHPSSERICSNVAIASSKVTEFVVDNYNEGLYSTTFAIDTSKDVDPVEITFSITENLFGPIIAKLDEHAGVMYCTGHLHMTTVIPNVNVLEYLDHLNQLDSHFALSIKDRFPEAIEREMSERRDGDGSFSWFGNDPTGSPHVTSLVLQAFQRASKYVEVDLAIIERGLNYLVSSQLESGEIAKEENPFEYPFEKNVGVGLTAMVLLAFLHNEEVKQRYKEFIDKAFSYIVSNIEVINCVYDLALAFYAMQLARHSYAVTLKERLLKLAKRDSVKNYVWWPYLTVPNADPDYQPPVSELEVTSYVLLGLLETEPVEDLLPIVKWMLPTGSFANESMDRAIALDAILKMAAKCGTALAVMELDYKAYSAEGTFIGKIILTPENSSRILTQVLPLSTEKVEFQTKDKGTFFGNITYRYREL